MNAALVRIDHLARQAWLGDSELQLSRLQFELLAYLTSRAGHVCSREDVAQAVWQSRWTLASSAVSMCLMQLRRALGDDAYHPRYIKTLWCVGWRFERSMLDVPESQMVDIDGVSYEVLNWEKQPHSGATRTFVLHAREVTHG